MKVEGTKRLNADYPENSSTEFVSMDESSKANETTWIERFDLVEERIEIVITQMIGSVTG